MVATCVMEAGGCKDADGRALIGLIVTLVLVYNVKQSAMAKFKKYMIPVIVLK